MNEGWADTIARGLIRSAARKAPPALSERLGEEWLADLDARCGTLSRLRFALGCCWARAVIARELRAPVRLAAAAAGDKAAVVYAGPGPSFLSRRTMVFALIICLHGLVIYGLATGMARAVLKALPERIDIVFLPKEAPRIQPPPPLDPQLTRLRPEISLPPLKMVPAEPPVTIRDPVDQARPLEPSAPPQTKALSRVVGGPGAGFPNTDDYYPAASRRLGEQGIATVGVCVDGTGRLTATPTIEESSGSARLDEGALTLARAGSGHYRPTTEGGGLVSGCYAFRVRFELKD
jgi:periplasmic protein TonB